MAAAGGAIASSSLQSGSGNKTFQIYLPRDNNRIYVCLHCRAHLACHEDLISKSFQGSQGRAYLFNKVVNVGTGKAEERYLLTGLHAVADIYCESCKNTLGWKYEQAFESSQKYKEGKFIIELIHLIKDNGWDSPTNECADSGGGSSNSADGHDKSPTAVSSSPTNIFNFFNLTNKKCRTNSASSSNGHSSSSCSNGSGRSSKSDFENLNNNSTNKRAVQSTTN
jgi:hypothetical protein